MLKPVLLGHVNESRVVLHHFSHSGIKQRLCNLFAKVNATVYKFMPLFLFEVPLTSGRLRTEVVCLAETS